MASASGGERPPEGLRADGPPPGVHWTTSAVSVGGVALTTASAVVLLSLLAVGVLGFRGSAYLGILAYLVLPTLFVLGLLLIPAGLWLQRRRLRRALAAGAPPPGLPVIDLNRSRTRRALLLFVAATAANVVVLGVATYEGVQLLGSTAFCGSCHRVMDPESTAHRRSNHARVACVDCHIGAGASWFVKSKLSGSWQVIAYAFRLYPRPIPVPVTDLRPARDTCEQCHWPSKLVGDRLSIVSHFGDDERNRRTETVLLLHVGAGGAGAQGIHAHVAQGVQVRYRADASRQHVLEVERTSPRGTTTWRTADAGSAQAGEWRVMDCVDCHNRPTHVFPPPEDAIDAALAAGRIDETLPFVRREGLAALRTPYPSHDAARAGIRSRLSARYAELHPEVARSRAAAVDAASAELGRIFAENVWPGMNVGWNTYPSFAGHRESPGCFRCHDEEHRAGDGRTISQDCSLCHELLAVDEPNPPILKQLGR